MIDLYQPIGPAHKHAGITINLEMFHPAMSAHHPPPLSSSSRRVSAQMPPSPILNKQSQQQPQRSPSQVIRTPAAGAVPVKQQQTQLPPALHQLSSFLRSDDDLDKISTLKEQLIKEKSTLEVSLKNQIKLILDRTLLDLNKLQIASDDVKLLRESIGVINDVKDQSFGSIKRFELIDKITQIHEILEHSIDIHDKISQFESDLSEVERLIDSVDLDYIDEESQIPELLPIHFKLNKLRDFQDQLLELSKFASDDSKFIIKRLFSKIFVVVGKFDRLLDVIISLLVEICKVETNNSLVIRFAKLLEIEENQDAYIELKRGILSKKTPENSYDNNSEKYVMFEQILNGNIKGRLESRNYKRFFMDKLEESIKDIFAQCWQMCELRSKEDPSKYTIFDILEELDWIYQDLKTVQLKMTQLTPQNWDIFQIYYSLYFENLQKTIQKLIDLEPETTVILEILDFDSRNQQLMKTEFSLAKDQIKSIFSENEREKLLADYLSLLILKMSEWLSNINQTEREIFIKRLEAPQQDEEKLYLLQGNKIIFQMFMQQCDVAAGSKQGKIINGTIEEFSKRLVERQGKWGKLIKSETVRLLKSNNQLQQEKEKKEAKEEAEKEDVVAPGLIEYLTALANDQMRGAEHSEMISLKYSQIVYKKYSDTIHSNMELVIDGFANLAKQCCDAILVIIFDDLNGVFPLVFHKKWINSNFIQQIIETLNEYLQDLQVTLNPYLFEILVEDILEECIVRYLSAINGATIGPKDLNKALGQIKMDFEKFFKLFSTGFEVDPQVIEHKFKIIECLFELLELPEYDSDNNSEEFIHRVEEITKVLNGHYQDIKGAEFVKLVLVKFKKIKEKNLAKIDWNGTKREVQQQIGQDAAAAPSLISRLSFDL